jgi:hypothetical protein
MPLDEFKVVCSSIYLKNVRSPAQILDICLYKWNVPVELKQIIYAYQGKECIFEHVLYQDIVAKIGVVLQPNEKNIEKIEVSSICSKICEIVSHMKTYQKYEIFVIDANKDDLNKLAIDYEIKKFARITLGGYNPFEEYWTCTLQLTFNIKLKPSRVIELMKSQYPELYTLMCNYNIVNKM